MKKKKKYDYVNILAAISALLSFVMAIVLIVYFMGNKTTQIKTIILISLFGASIISFIICTILYFLGTPSLKNK
jgi:predicted membrane channel-forming protein YqfA (hemolysin III family)